MERVRWELVLPLAGALLAALVMVAIGVVVWPSDVSLYLWLVAGPMGFAAAAFLVDLFKKSRAHRRKILLKDVVQR